MSPTSLPGFPSRSGDVEASGYRYRFAMLTERPDVCEALDRAQVFHLTAVSPEGQPQTTPVWFLRDGDDLIVYNQPTSPRLASIAVNDRVSAALRGDVAADGAVLIEGRARVDEALPSPDSFPAYLDKYAAVIVGLGWTPEQFASEYPVGVRITPTRVRAWGVDHVMAAEG